MRILLLIVGLSLSVLSANAQLQWTPADSLYGPLPAGVHVFQTTDKIDTGAFRAFYLIADLKDRRLKFTTDTTHNRRLTPSQFWERNDKPLVVVNGTFFSFETNQNLNLVIKNKKLASYNRHDLAGRGKDTFTYRHVWPSAIGINKGKADVAWTYTDSATGKIYASQYPRTPQKDSLKSLQPAEAFKFRIADSSAPANVYPQRWKMETAIGGGPVLLQNGNIRVTNNEELKFGGKGIQDKHPRTAMGYTASGKLIILVVEGRNPAASGATLIQEAQILKDLGCVEALNLDGGGSSCLLINGKPTIKVADKEGQRPVPAVFLIQAK